MPHTQGHRTGKGGQQKKTKPKGPFGDAPAFNEKGEFVSGRRQVTNIKHAVIKLKGRKKKRGLPKGMPKRFKKAIAKLRRIRGFRTQRGTKV